MSKCENPDFKSMPIEVKEISFQKVSICKHFRQVPKTAKGAVTIAYYGSPIKSCLECK